MNPPTVEELQAVVSLKHGAPAKAGWGVRRRMRHGFFTPDEWYEALLRRLVTDQTRWLEVGAGASISPHDAPLAREVSQRAALLVGVDPSPNLDANPFVHERARCAVEEYQDTRRFDLATMRMVAEHVTDPPRVIAKLHELLVPGGLVVVYTVNRWTPVAVLSGLAPHRLHYPLKRLFWGGEEKDTFPVAYKLNTRRALRRAFEAGGFSERLFLRLDDLAMFSQVRVMNWIEIKLWRLIHGLGLRYPENCLLGVYERGA